MQWRTLSVPISEVSPWRILKWIRGSISEKQAYFFSEF
jgi:hypothetical protein